MKKFLKTLLMGFGILFIVVFILLFIDIKNDDSSVSPSPTIVVEEKDNQEDIKQIFEDSANAIFKDNYGDNYTFTLDGDTYTLGVWHEGLVEEVGALKNNPNNENLANAWENVIDKFNDLGKSCKETLDRSGLYNYHFIINLLNEQNLDNTLLTIYDGQVIYNVIEE